MKNNVGRNYERDSVSVFWYVLLTIAVIFGYTFNPDLGLSNSTYMRFFELCMNISSLFGMGVLGCVIKMEQVLKKHYDISFYAVLLFLLWFFGIVISFAAGIKLSTNVDIQTEGTQLKKGDTVSGTKITNINISSIVTVINVSDVGEELKIDRDYIIQSVSVKSTTIVEKIKEFPVWILCKICKIEMVKKITIYVSVKGEEIAKLDPSEPSGDLSQTEETSNSNIANDELLVGVRDHLASWGEYSAYFKNPYSRQGEIRYKKNGQSEWSDWEKVGEEDIKVPLLKNTQYTFAWRVGEYEEERAWNSSNSQKTLRFINKGEIYFLNNRVLKDLMEKAKIENILDKWKISVEFLVSDPQNDEKVEGCLLGLTMNLDTSESGKECQLCLRTRDDILVYCEVNGKEKGYYCAYQGGPMKETNGTEHKINWISASEADKSNARLIVKLYFKEKL